MVLHGNPDDPSHRYISRMQQAVRVLYGSASPSEAFQATTLELAAVDVDAFLGQVANNAAAVGIADVEYHGHGAPVPVRADEFALEDAITHVLRNADRYRPAGTPVSIRLAVAGAEARITLHNRGAPIAPDLLDKIFEYGVSDPPADGAEGQRGQGLFVARTYMAKMGGTIVARNLADGVEFELTLRLAGAGGMTG
jgi:signal transduction histidine kinase